MSAITNIKCTPFSWTDSNFNIAKDLYQKGIRASIIAKELGTTKNAVLGKMHRHKLSTPSPHTFNKSSNTYFKQYGEANCLICKKKYKTYSKFDRFCSPCKSRDFYKHLT